MERTSVTRERLRIASGSPCERVIGFSRAVRVRDRVHLSDTRPVSAGGDCPAEAVVSS